jgi:3-oxoacyl-[acyl-carrier protein] reductase
MPQRLKEKVAVVTGASKGIGAAIAKHLASEGAHIIVNYTSSKEDAEKVTAEIIKNGGKAIAVQGDVSKEKDIESLFAQTVKAFGKVDILINNAGVYEFIPLEDISSKAYHKMFDINVFGLLMASKEAVKHFGPNGGSIVNISSVASTKALANASIYCATKASVDAITRCLAHELGPRNIRVNSINPGMVETEGTQHAGIMESDFKKKTEQETPLGRIGIPKDIAPAVAFIASEEASWITGETLFISGGHR